MAILADVTVLAMASWRTGPRGRFLGLIVLVDIAMHLPIMNGTQHVAFGRIVNVSILIQTIWTQ